MPGNQRSTSVVPTTSSGHAKPQTTCSSASASSQPHHDAVRASGGGGTPRGGGGHVGGLRSKLMVSASGLTTRTVAGRAGAPPTRADFTSPAPQGLAAPPCTTTSQP